MLKSPLFFFLFLGLRATAVVSDANRNNEFGLKVGGDEVLDNEVDRQGLIKEDNTLGPANEASVFENDLVPIKGRDLGNRMKNKNRRGGNKKRKKNRSYQSEETLFSEETEESFSEESASEDSYGGYGGASPISEPITVKSTSTVLSRSQDGNRPGDQTTTTTSVYVFGHGHGHGDESSSSTESVRSRSFRGGCSKSGCRGGGGYGCSKSGCRRGGGYGCSKSGCRGGGNRGCSKSGCRRGGGGYRGCSKSGCY